MNYPRRFCAFALFAILVAGALCYGQTENATISGRVTDSSGAVLPGAAVTLQSAERGTSAQTTTNNSGIYIFPNVQPGIYHITVHKDGFRSENYVGLTANVQDHLEQNFRLSVGAVSESVTVTANSLNINTTDGSVSTVVDQTYVQNMPLSGRSFQDLILLTPGVTTQMPQPTGPLAGLAGGNGQSGEFAVNGQRTESNYYTVDGVSANVGSSADANRNLFGSGPSGSVAASTALGTTQALVSVDALQEFRVQSSTYSAEYGRNPGGQFAFQTKSGANQWHGSAYDYLRNGFFDATDWFNTFNNLPPAALRQNDFGGTFGGPIKKDKTFFFVSYEGLRLTAPQPVVTTFVPDASLRTTAAPSLQPILNAWPLPTGPDQPNGMAQFVGTWSNPSSLDSFSSRLDHSVSDKLRLFFRFADTTSSSSSRGGGDFSPSMTAVSDFTLRSYTAGATALITNRLSNDCRLNYTSNETNGTTSSDSFGSAVPVDVRQRAGLTPGSLARFSLNMPGQLAELIQLEQSSAQHQWNLVDTFSYILGRHQFKFGVDYRRLTPFSIQSNPQYQWVYNSPNSVQTDNADVIAVDVQNPAYPLYQNFSAFAQDEWKVSQRLTLSLGVRWEVNPPPGVTRGLMPFTLLGTDATNWILAPQGTPLWKTTWSNFAPRLGVAYQVRRNEGWETVLRGGAGVFFDTGQQTGSNGFNGPGFITMNLAFPGGAFPGTVTPLPIPPNPSISDCACGSGFYPHLQLPYTIQWNASVQQSLGKSQALTVSYVASHASRLLKSDLAFDQFFDAFYYTENGLTSDYDSLQTQFQRHLSHGLTALASYTWSHCIDWGSSNLLVGFIRGNCDFDVRHNFNAAFSYDVPNVGESGLAKALLHRWGLDQRLTARSAFPVTLGGSESLLPNGQVFFSGLNYDPTRPLYISQCVDPRPQATGQIPCPGGKGINPNAFSPAPTDPMTGLPELSNAPRNFVRGFGAWQMDLAVRREFPITERVKLNFRAEAFNVFNHPNFASLNTDIGNTKQFGEATATLANSLGTLSPLYQLGGPRSMQFALKLVF
jgi:Carboxypeptidase regulatory-like domain/TonB dependent receptor